MRTKENHFHLLLHGADLLVIPVRFSLKFLETVLVILELEVLRFLRFSEKPNRASNPDDCCPDNADAAA